MTIRRILVALQALVALFALAGGAALVLRPDGSMLHLDPAEMNGVFASYFYPGVVLLGLGMLNAVGAWLMARHQYLDTVVAASAGGTLMLWVAMQMILLEPTTLQQVVAGTVGFLIFTLASELVHEGEGPHWLPTEAKCAARDW